MVVSGTMQLHVGDETLATAFQHGYGGLQHMANIHTYFLSVRDLRMNHPSVPAKRGREELGQRKEENKTDH